MKIKSKLFSGFRIFLFAFIAFLTVSIFMAFHSSKISSSAAEEITAVSEGAVAVKTTAPAVNSVPAAVVTTRPAVQTAVMQTTRPIYTTRVAVAVTTSIGIYNGNIQYTIYSTYSTSYTAYCRINDCYEGVEGEYDIPEKIDGFFVKEIASGAFSNCTKLESVIIPETVTSIGSEAFKDCTGLKKIVINNPYCQIYTHWDTIPETAVIYGWKDSTAQKYAADLGMKFVELKGTSPITTSTMTTTTTSTTTTRTTAKYTGTGTNTTYRIMTTYRAETKATTVRVYRIYDNYIQYYTTTTAVINDCKKSKSGDVVLPNTIDDMKVVSITASAFSDCKNITSILIPENVKTIILPSIPNRTTLPSINSVCLRHPPHHTIVCFRRLP